MYGLPPDLNLRFFKGLALNQVCVGAHDVILRFHPDTSLTIGSTMRFEPAEGEAVEIKDYRATAGSLLGLIGHPVHRAHRTEEGALRLEWEQGDALELHDSSPHAESYTIRHGDSLLVVV